MGDFQGVIYDYLETQQPENKEFYTTIVSVEVMSQ